MTCTGLLGGTFNPPHNGHVQLAETAKGHFGLDPLRVHVDTDRKVVTLSGTVESAAEREKAVALVRGLKDVAGVTDHLFVGPTRK